jgi:hypothetical protein
VYLVVLLVTWWTLRGASARLDHRLILSASTNVTNMRHDPVQVLISSAFWPDSTAVPWQMVIEFLIVMVAAERWLGTRRLVAVFAAGHIGATLLTFAGIVYGLDQGLLPVEVAKASDVGTSYGLYAVAALLVFRFPPRWRLLSASALTTYLVFSAWNEPTFTAFGHLAAITIGFAAYPVIANTIKSAPRRSAVSEGQGSLRANGAGRGHGVGTPAMLDRQPVDEGVCPSKVAGPGASRR